MMKLLAKRQETRRRIVGRLSDGSDHNEVLETPWVCRVLDEQGREHHLEFGADPTNQEIIDAMPKPTDLTPIRKADLEIYMVEKYETWLRWRTTRLEAQARSMAAAIITALQNKEDAAWVEYATAINAWRTAT